MHEINIWTGNDINGLYYKLISKNYIYNLSELCIRTDG